MAYGDNNNRKLTPVGIVAGVSGFVGSQFLGANLLVPSILWIIAFVCIRKFRKQAGNFICAAVALTIGQTGWMVVGVIILPNQLAAVLPDLVIGLALICWCLASLSRASAIGLIVYEVAALGINIWVAMRVGHWGPQMASLVTHIVLRTAIVCFAALAIRDGMRQILPEAEAEVFS